MLTFPFRAARTVLSGPDMALGGLVIALACLYLNVSRKIDVGYFNDDARYISAARSLDQGEYRDLELPGHPPNIDRLPGYPFFLLPFVHVLAPHWPWLKITSILLTCWTAVLVYILFEDWLPPWPRVSVIALLGLNPTIMKYSCSAMSEAFFLFLVVLTFVLLKKWLESDRERLFWLMSLVIAWAVLARPEGIALPPALSLGLALNRRRRESLRLLWVPASALGLWMWRNDAEGGSPSGYLHQMGQIAASLSGHYFPVLENILRVCRVFLIDALLQASFPAPNASLDLWLTSVLCAAAIAVLVRGFVRQAQRAGILRIVNLSMGIFALIYGVMHGVFLSVNSRYCFALIPFGLIWLAAGFGTCRPRFLGPRLWSFVGLGGLLLCYENPWSSGADKIMASSHAYTIPLQTYAWIREMTVPDAFILAIKANTVNLYTDRFSISEVPAAGLEELRDQLLAHRITHILVAPARLMILQGKDFQNMLTLWNTANLWLPQWPEAFEKVYGNAEEKTSIYRVLASSPLTMRRSNASAQRLQHLTSSEGGLRQ